MNSLTVLIFFLSSLTISLTTTTTTTPSGTIQRTTKQQILASIPPSSPDNSQPFLTSPSGKYTALLLRRETAPAAGGFGNDFCYIQVQETSSGQSLWESECAPVSTANTCSLVFDDNGLDVFDGSNPVWDTGADNDFLETLQIVDEGDMRIIDRDGELAWKASDDPRSNQGCGLPGSAGLAPESPPFAKPLGGDVSNLPFGQGSQQGGGSAIPNPSLGLGFNGQQEQQQQQQPLVDNTAFESGCSRRVLGGFLGVGLGLVIMVVVVMVHGHV
ncbi:uncharacterized protein LOC120284187 [Dioscorea cayenensis subsp. rotundata]|uniref:Uncharacterized protein LOC120284187 n=1 Tax=Dioscorea cayennensis subsp. rotundata TaxID=55577 RepID=A0AB40AHE0_DIOCR|nr:uncharacterized protein LOC120284187 [Dioscorea cayenensis subsp. rotundata]